MSLDSKLDEPKQASTQSASEATFKKMDFLAIRIASYIFALGSIAGGILRLIYVHETDTQFGSTTLGYFAAALVFLLLPYAKTFEFFGVKLELKVESLKEDVKVMNLTLLDEKKKIASNKEKIESLKENEVVALGPYFVAQGLPAPASAAIPPSQASPYIDLPDFQTGLRDLSPPPPAPQAPRPVAAYPEPKPDSKNELQKLALVARTMKPGNVKDDPWKGQFGSNAEANGRRLSATITPNPDDEDWFKIHLKVKSVDQSKPLTGKVQFFVHDSYVEDKPIVPVDNGIASLDLESWGAFTVGVLADFGTTKLELDLAQIASFPKKFRGR